MIKIIECIPNFSEGQDESVLEAIAQAARSVAGVTLMDYSGDPDYNRSVFSLIGSPQGIKEAAFQMCAVAKEKIDMTKQSGVHPRMGATDVMPFVPIRNTDMDECIEISKSVANRIWNELGIPCFLYEESATSLIRKNLANIRSGGFEGMKEKILLPEWKPDFGDTIVHPTAGVTAIGARMPLIAFNVSLGSNDINIANKIAKAVRGSSGGFEGCKAIGVYLKERNIVQVSINFVNYKRTPIFRVFESIKNEALRYGVNVTGSELIGLAPLKAFTDCASHYLQLENDELHTKILESFLF